MWIKLVDAEQLIHNYFFLFFVDLSRLKALINNSTAPTTITTINIYYIYSI